MPVPRILWLALPFLAPLGGVVAMQLLARTGWVTTGERTTNQFGAEIFEVKSKLYHIPLFLAFLAGMLVTTIVFVIFMNAVLPHLL